VNWNSGDIALAGGGTIDNFGQFNANSPASSRSRVQIAAQLREL
jgi:hypothetical protein